MTRAAGDDGMLAERDLRHALRLDAEELPPRLDAAALAARARERSRLAVASVASAMVAVAAAATLVLGTTIALVAVAPELVTDAYGIGLGLLASAAVPLADLLDTFEQPSIPIATLSAVVFAIAYEFGQRKERANVINAS